MGRGWNINRNRSSSPTWGEGLVSEERRERGGQGPDPGVCVIPN